LRPETTGPVKPITAAFAAERIFVLIVAEKTKKITRAYHHTPHIVFEKKPIEADAYYTIRELTDKSSPFWICSPTSIFNALRTGALKPSYINRKVLLKGSAVHDWIQRRGANG
jgi:hypothetical protein